MSASDRHSHPIAVGPADIDFMGHANNAHYLSWVQAAVIEHWRRFAPLDALATHAWVAFRHDITYRRPAFLDDQLIAEVVLRKVAGARAFYDTVIRRGEEVLAEVSSAWVCVDAATQRPMRLAREIVQAFFGTAEPAQGD